MRLSGQDVTCLRSRPLAGTTSFCHRIFLSDSPSFCVLPAYRAALRLYFASPGPTLGTYRQPGVGFRRERPITADIVADFSRAAPALIARRNRVLKRAMPRGIE